MIEQTLMTAIDGKAGQDTDASRREVITRILRACRARLLRVAAWRELRARDMKHERTESPAAKTCGELCECA